MANQKTMLRKELSLLNIYAIATGATLSSGYFLLPGIAAAEAGPAVILSYLIAAIPLIPSLFSQAELATAMPRAGGVYYFLDRSMGPLFGTIGGVGSWLSLILKTAFALIGMGAYLSLIIPDLPIVPIAAVLAILFGGLNVLGAKKSGSFQVQLVIGLLLLLCWFSGMALFQVKASHFSGFFDKGFDSIFAAAGLVYVSFVGITNIASVSEEVKNPEKNLPLGMFLALGSSLLIYGLGTYAMVGILEPENFYGNLTPVASAARVIFGEWGEILMIIAAVLSFFSVTNAGIMSASRYPLAMGRDHLMPGVFRKLSRFDTPQNSIFITVALVLVCIIVIDPTGIAKLAGAFQLLLFALNSAALIVMRESLIESYDPGFRSPLYPWMQLFGIFGPITLIVAMGWLPILFSLGLVAMASAWYFYYGKDRVVREGAVYHIFARLGQRRFVGLDGELRGILKEKGVRDEDPYELIVARAAYLDVREHLTFEEIVQEASKVFSKRMLMETERFVEGFMEGTRAGATPVSHGAALPHMRIKGTKQPELVIIRSIDGVEVAPDDFSDYDGGAQDRIYAFFFVVSPEENPGQHLRILAQLAGHVDEEKFMENWRNAQDDHDVRQILLRDERFLILHLEKDGGTAELIGKTIRELELPSGSLIAIIHRNNDILIPHGSTILDEGDRLTLIANPTGIVSLRKKFRTDQ